MARRDNRSVPLWEKLSDCAVYLRIFIIVSLFCLSCVYTTALAHSSYYIHAQVASCLAFISAAITLKRALNGDDPAGGAAEESSSSNISLKASVVAGEVMAVALITILVQAAFILVTKLSPYEPASWTHLCIQIVVSCLAYSHPCS